MNEGRKSIPSVAVLMSTYNGEKFLDEQLNSVARQTYSNIVIFIRDDCSADSTLEIIKKWSRKIKIIQIPATQNLGPALSFIELIKVCPNYDYYAFCDQDDIWDPDKIEVAVNKLQQINEPALYFCRSRNIDAGGTVLDEDSVLESRYLTVESELTCGFCPGCAMVFNNELYEVVRKQYYRNIPMHDMIFIMTALAIGKVVYDEDIHFSRRMHEGNVVGKRGKNFFQKISQSCNNWFKNSKNSSYDKFIIDFVINTEDMRPVYNMEEMMALANYKKTIRNKIKIISSKHFVSASSSGLRSFRLRIIFNLL